jgi:hypothetical protein
VYVQGHPEGEAVRITSDSKDPLVIALAEALKLVGVDIQGISLINPDEFLNVKIVGGSTGGGTVTETDPVDIIDLLPSTALRDNASKTVALPDLKRYKRYVIQVSNYCDQDIKVVPWNTCPAVLEDNSVGIFSTTAVTDDSYSWVVPKKDANTSGLFYLNILEPKSNGAGTKKVKAYERLFDSVYSISGTTMMLAYKAVAAPTGGNLTIRFIGFKR